MGWMVTSHEEGRSSKVFQWVFIRIGTTHSFMLLRIASTQKPTAVGA
jgi:hypothetical protein